MSVGGQNKDMNYVFILFFSFFLHEHEEVGGLSYVRSREEVHQSVLWII